LVLVVFAASRLFYLIAGALLVEVVPVQRQTLDVSIEALSILAHFGELDLVSISYCWPPP
jgi:hypothetical protein